VCVCVCAGVPLQELAPKRLRAEAGSSSSSDNTGGGHGDGSAPGMVITVLVTAPRDLQPEEALAFEHAGRRYTTLVPTFAKQV